MNRKPEEITLTRKLSFSTLKVRVAFLGADCHILLTGGERPHIGCTAIAFPRPSLKGDDTWSSTSSVLNVTGHKDEFLCRRLAEMVSAALGSVVVCTGGFHVDGITGEEIEKVVKGAQMLGEEIVERLDVKRDK